MTDDRFRALIADALPDWPRAMVDEVWDALAPHVVLRSEYEQLQADRDLCDRYGKAASNGLDVAEARVVELEAALAAAQSNNAELRQALRWRCTCVGEECEDAEYEAARLLGEMADELDDRLRAQDELEAVIREVWPLHVEVYVEGQGHRLYRAADESLVAELAAERARVAELEALVSWIDGACVDEMSHTQIRGAINRSGGR